MVRQKLTQKERDIETNLDYFLARYYSSTQGRFTGADPYDINFERQETTDREEADELFTKYIGQPQHWNRYTYALNNPLLYVDPDGRKDEVYTIALLGQDITVRISDKISKEDQEAIKANIGKAIAKINSGADKLTPNEIKAVNSMKGITVNPSVAWSHTDGRTFMLTKDFAKGGENDWLAGAILHDSFHADQNSRGKKSTGLEAEKEASAFALPIARKLGLNSGTIRTLEYDSIHGHGPPSNDPYSRPKKKKTP